jgi:hypothetical protein
MSEARKIWPPLVGQAGQTKIPPLPDPPMQGCYCAICGARRLAIAMRDPQPQRHAAKPVRVTADELLAGYERTPGVRVVNREQALAYITARATAINVAERETTDAGDT